MTINLNHEEVIMILSSLCEVNFTDRKKEQTALYERLARRLQRSDKDIYDRACQAGLIGQLERGKRESATRS